MYHRKRNPTVGTACAPPFREHELRLLGEGVGYDARELAIPQYDIAQH